jgi:hypothetical protein
MKSNLAVNLSGDRAINGDLEIVARATLKKFTKLFEGSPPAGERPIYVFYRPEGPITDSTSDVTVYRIGLTVCDLKYNQLVFQFSHEICHVYADPRRSNWFIESCCEMLSQVMLRLMSKTWERLVPFRDKVTYAPKFESYAKNRVRDAALRIFQNGYLPGQEQLSKWFVSIKETLAKEPRDYERNVIIAEMLRPLFENSAANWDALRFLGQASASPPVDLKDLDVNSGFSFDRWLNIVPEHLKDLVQRISSMLEN